MSFSEFEIKTRSQVLYSQKKFTAKGGFPLLVGSFCNQNFVAKGREFSCSGEVYYSWYVPVVCARAHLSLYVCGRTTIPFNASMHSKRGVEAPFQPVHRLRKVYCSKLTFCIFLVK